MVLKAGTPHNLSCLGFAKHVAKDIMMQTIRYLELYRLTYLACKAPCGFEKHEFIINSALWSFSPGKFPTNITHSLGEFLKIYSTLATV